MCPRSSARSESFILARAASLGHAWQTQQSASLACAFYLQRELVPFSRQKHIRSPGEYVCAQRVVEDAAASSAVSSSALGAARKPP
eukprot:6097404-Amphidinium_carterae.4